MDTVLGLSLTSTSVGQVLVEGHDADGAILDHDDFDVPPTAGLQAVQTSEQATRAVLDAQAAAATSDQRLHAVALTWSDDAAAEAALLVESLTDAGFDNVVPVRLLDACDMLARAIAPMVGYERAAVCVLDGDSTVVVMVDAEGHEPQTAIKQLAGGSTGLVQWLTALFERSRWQPGGVVLVGDEHEVDALSARLTSLPVPVITQAGSDLALARGAALVSVQSTEFTDDEMLETVDRWRRDHDAARRQRPYAGAVTMLAAGAVTFVASLSLALGPHLVPSHAPDPGRPVAHYAARAPIDAAPAPPPVAVQPPPARSAPRPEPAPEPVVRQQPVVAPAPVDVPAAAPVVPPAPPPPVEPPPDPHPLLTKLLQRLHGQDPDQQPPPPPPGAPAP